MDAGTLALWFFLQEFGLSLATIIVAVPICVALVSKLRKPGVSWVRAALFGVLCGSIPWLNIAIAIILWRSLPKKEKTAKK